MTERISRREFLKWAGRGVVAVGVTVLSGCEPQQKPSVEPTSEPTELPFPPTSVPEAPVRSPENFDFQRFWREFDAQAKALEELGAMSEFGPLKDEHENVVLFDTGNYFYIFAFGKVPQEKGGFNFNRTDLGEEMNLGLGLMVVVKANRNGGIEDISPLSNVHAGENNSWVANAQVWDKQNNLWKEDPSQPLLIIEPIPGEPNLSQVSFWENGIWVLGGQQISPDSMIGRVLAAPVAIATSTPEFTPTPEPTVAPTPEQLTIPQPVFYDQDNNFDFAPRPGITSEQAMDVVRECWLMTLAKILEKRGEGNYEELLVKLENGEINQVELTYPVPNSSGTEQYERKTAMVDLTQPLVLAFQTYNPVWLTEAGGVSAMKATVGSDSTLRLRFSVSEDGQLTIRVFWVPDAVENPRLVQNLFAHSVWTPFVYLAEGGRVVEDPERTSIDVLAFNLRVTPPNIGKVTRKLYFVGNEINPIIHGQSANP